MGQFDGLQDTDSSDSEEKVSLINEIQISTVEVSNDDVAEDLEDWETVTRKKKPQQLSTSTCFICLLTVKPSLSYSLPCSLKCNPEDLVIHLLCFEQWQKQQQQTSCPLCRAPVTLKPKVQVVEDDEYDFFQDNVKFHKSRINPEIRMGRTNTYKATMQRQYSQGKRQNQRQNQTMCVDEEN